MGLPDVRCADSDADIRRCFPVMRVLRPHLATEEDFFLRAKRQMAGSGWRLIYAAEDDVPVAVAGFRISEWLAYGKALYVDDLVALETHRGQGYAGALMRWMEAFAEREGCAVFHLDSGTQRLGAHRFYHRLGLAITSFHFAKTLRSGF